MSFESPQQAAAAEAARSQSQRATQLADISLPQLSDILGRVKADLNVGGIAPSVRGQYDTARAGINQDFAQAGRGDQAYIGQQFAQSGGIYNANQIADTRFLAAQNLETERRKAMRTLDFQEAEAGMGQFNTLLNLLGVGSGAAMNLSAGFSQAQAQAIGGLSNQSTGQGALGGAAAGASLGTTISPGWGTLIGGVLGGVAGYAGAGG